MTKFTKQNTNQMKWSEVDHLIDEIISKMSAYFANGNETVNVIAPLLRTGGIVGGIISIKMHILAMLPVQLKYFYNPTTIKQVLSIPEILIDVPNPMNILLCEGNTSSGSISIKAAKVIKEKYPQAKIYLATLTKVFGCPENLEGIEHIFYGRMTNENFKATDDEKKEFDLRDGITIFPWEDADDELLDINAGGSA
jgi:hypothetical protein